MALLQGCGSNGRASRPPIADPWEGRGRECVRPFVGGGSPYGDAPDAPSAREHAILARVPPEAARTMRAAGVSALVARALAEASENVQPTVELLLTRQELGMRLISLETQLAAVIFEVECTGELIEAMTFELEDRADLRELRLALSSLAVGAVSSIAAGVWEVMGRESKGPPVIGLVGGAIGAGLGGAAFFQRPEHMQFRHPRNLLAPVVEGRDDRELFPRFVFRLLASPPVDGGPSPRERLLARWRTLIAERLPSRRRAGAETLLFGSGGVYDPTLLALRERLYDALESELNAQARDLELLDRFLVRALERTASP